MWDARDRPGVLLAGLSSPMGRNPRARHFGPRPGRLTVCVHRLRRGSRPRSRLRNRGRLARRHRLSRRLGRDRGGRGRRVGHHDGNRRDHHWLDRRNRLCARPRFGRRGRKRLRRQERERVDVALVVRGPAQAEVHEGLREVEDAAGPDGAHACALCYRRAALDVDRAQMHKGRRVAGSGLDRHGLAAGRHRAGERDDTAGGRRDVTAGGGAEVDTAVLSSSVRMRPIEREGPQHGPVDRPRPRLRDGWE